VFYGLHRCGWKEVNISDERRFETGSSELGTDILEGASGGSIWGRYAYDFAT
jgi:hypothetical protein